MDDIYKKAWPCAYTYQGIRRIWLWYYDPTGTVNLLQKEADGHLLVAKDEKSLADSIKRLNLTFEIMWDELSENDLDDFFEKLAGLEANKELSTEVCNILLKGINVLMDLADTLAIYDDLALFNSPLPQGVYNKIFAGNNLPAVIRDNPHYHPIMEITEVHSLQQTVAEAWQLIILLATEIIL